MGNAEATTGRRGAARERLLVRLLKRGWEFDFFQAVWLLERSQDALTPLGDRGPAGREVLHLRPALSMGFPATDVRRIRRLPNGEGETPRYRLEATFLGLYGVATPLPLHYAVDVLRAVEREAAPPGDEGDAESDAAIESDEGAAPARDFLDILHHRVISLFYRSWTKYRHYASFGTPGRDVVTDYLFWLIGCAPGWGTPLLGVPPIRLLRYAGLLTQQPRSAVGLEGLLRDYSDGIPACVEQFVGRWVPLGDGDLNRIGRTNSRLGEDLTVGGQVYDVSGKFNITVGPVDWATYLTYLPDGPRFGETCSLTRLYGKDPLSFNVVVRLRAGEVPALRLSSDDAAGRLGYTSWVRTDEMPETAVTFDASSAAPGAAA